MKSTRKWELRESSHPVIEPLLEYKSLSRLHTANGWSWLDAWVDGGRFRPEYVVGGVVSGRWASRGGGALQIPRQVRGAVHADPGHKLIVADASQLEPRVLVALAQDSSMAEAARDQDLYAGIAAKGFGGDRAKAKMALLGAMYGATSGEAGRLMPQLARTYPRAVDFVERAARAGEAGGTVTTRLGRSSPPPSERWFLSQRSATAEEQRRAESIARSRGRFTRNFVVQGSAADWAACWLAELRRRLRTLRAARADGSGAGRPELVFFLHDEVMVHAPEEGVDGLHRRHRGSGQRGQGAVVRPDSGGVSGEPCRCRFLRPRQIVCVGSAGNTHMRRKVTYPAVARRVPWAAVTVKKQADRSLMQRRIPGRSPSMAGRFEIHRVGDESYRLRLTDAEGNIVAVSPTFPSVSMLRDGIKAMRENAATGIVVDLRQQQA